MLAVNEGELQEGGMASGEGSINSAVDVAGKTTYKPNDRKWEATCDLAVPEWRKECHICGIAMEQMES